GLLGNCDVIADRAEQIDLAQMPAEGGQTGGRRKVPSDLRAAKLYHGDEPPSVGFSLRPKCRFITADCPSPTEQVAPNWGQIWVILVYTTKCHPEIDPLRPAV